MKKAQALMEAKQWAEAKTVLEPLAGSYVGERGAGNPLWLEAVTEQKLGDTNAEYASLQKIAAQDADFTDLYVRLIEMSGARQDWAAETKYANRLLQINPLISAPYRALAGAGAGAGNPDQAIAAYRRLILLDSADPAETHFRLASLLHLRGGAEARRNGRCCRPWKTPRVFARPSGCSSKSRPLPPRREKPKRRHLILISIE